MKKSITAFLLLILTLISVVLCGCEAHSDDHKQTTQIFAMDTVIDITAYGEKAQKAIDEAAKVIRNLDKLFSVTNEKSDVYKLNNAKGELLLLNSDTYSLLTIAREIYYLTNQNFDITIYPVMKLWGFTTDSYKVPSQDEIEAELEKVNCSNIFFLDKDIACLENGAQIDLGGIAKGYAADKAAQAMKDAGIEYGIITIGGNVRTVGTKPSGEDFTVGIQDPESENYFAVINTGEGSVITSGAYQRNFTENGKTYHHIIDPRTGYPSDSDAVSVTIIGKDGAVCDALSTAVFIGGSEYAYSLREKYDEFEYVILTKDNKVIASKNLEGNLNLEDGYDFELIYK